MDTDIDRLDDLIDLANWGQYLTPRERTVIDLYYGLTTGGGISYAKIARLLGISRSRAQQIGVVALDKLKKRLAI